MRICFVGWGDHVHTERWVSRFADPRFELSVISFSGKGNYPAAVRQFDLDALPIRSHRLRMLFVRLLLKWLHPDIVHVHYAGFLTNIAPLWRGKLVVTVWGSDIYRAHILTAQQQADIATYLARAACVTCDSSDLATAIARFSPGAAAATHVVQWGVDLDVFSPTSSGAHLARRLGIAERPVFLSPRNFFPLYRLTEIVRAFAQVLVERPDAILLMKRYNADPDYSREIEALLDELNIRASVIIVERVEYDEMADYYRSGSVMVSVPESDGTPMSLLEAMACGCIPVISDLPSLREWVTDGVNGRLVAVGDVNGLARAMLEASNTPDRDSIVARNLSLVRERGSQRASTEQMVGLYRAVLDTDGSAAIGAAD